MAVIKLAPFATGISGVMKNLSFSTNGEDTIMKEREAPANPKTAKQSANRAYFSLSSKGYSALSPANLSLWKGYAAGLTFIGRKGKKPYTPNAFEAYKSLTQVWYAANAGTGTAPTAPPLAAYAGSTVTLMADASTESIDFTASAATPTGTVMEIGLQPLRNANRTPSAGGYRAVAYHAFAANALTLTLEVAPGVHAARYRFIDQATGQRTAYVEIPVSGVSLALRQGGAADEAAKPARAKKAA